MQCSEAKLLIHAYLDNELDAGDSVRLLRHLQTCAACASALAQHTQLKDLLHNATPQPALPEVARRRVLAALPTGSSTHAAAATSPSSRRPMQHWHALPIALAASLLLLIGGGFGVTLQQRASDTAALTADVLSGHLRSLQAQHLTDVTAGSQHTVKPWFDGKLEFVPQVPDLDAAGFPLAGGRLDVLHGRRVAAIVYHRRLHAINLFEWPEAASDAAPASADAGGGYHAVHWTQAGMTYWAVSSLNQAELDTFAQAFRGAAVPPSIPTH